jgi:hypothetical protein
VGNEPACCEGAFCAAWSGGFCEQERDKRRRVRARRGRSKRFWKLASLSLSITPPDDFGVCFLLPVAKALDRERQATGDVIFRIKYEAVRIVVSLD